MNLEALIDAGFRGCIQIAVHGRTVSKRLADMLICQTGFLMTAAQNLQLPLPAKYLWQPAFYS